MDCFGHEMRDIWVKQKPQDSVCGRQKQREPLTMDVSLLEPIETETMIQFPMRRHGPTINRQTLILYIQYAVQWIPVVFQ